VSPRPAILAAIGCAAATIALAAAGLADADVFGPISIGSAGDLAGGGGEQQQALYGHDPAISGSGRYVVFDGYFAGRSGVWRRELRPGEASGPIEPVAVGAQVPGSEGCAGAVPCDAVLPSVSANGQFVSFTTAARLDPVNDSNEAPDVYVRNMALGESQPGAFTLVSAADGTSAGLTYEGPLTHGAVASGRTAISADGNEVAFVTTAISDLTDPGTPGEPRTPALQVAVRNLSARTTELVSAEYDPATGQAKPGIPVSAFEANETWGAVYTTAAAGPSFPFNNRAYDLPPVVGASISADGTTVAWMGRVVHKQARMLPGEAGARYAEPLWRRIADGPLAPTRRVTGGSEPENPACAASGEQNVPAPGSASLSDPCQGPFAVTAESGVWAGSRGNADTVPQLSGDGYTVVFFAGAQLVALGSNFGRSGEELADLYIANMHPGLTRRAALRPLTELATGHETERAGDAPVVDASISVDGGQVAFVTQRTLFPLGSPSYVTQPAAAAGIGELFDVDLANDTLTRVSTGYAGGPSEHPGVTSQTPPALPTDGALSPSFSADGNTLAFASTASNLIYGDGNTPAAGGEICTCSSDGSDVFDVERRQFPPTTVEQYVSAAPANPEVAPEWRLGVTAVSSSNGTVRLYVSVPGAGTLSASALGTVPVARARRGRRARVAQRRVSATPARAVAPPGGLVQITLKLAPAYRALASRLAGLSATANITFTAPGRRALKQAIAVDFRVTAKRSKSSRRAPAKGRRHR
jgi:hypothetical protein